MRAVAALFLLLTYLPSASARKPKPAAESEAGPSPADKASAKAHYSVGKTFFDEQKYAEAIVEYQAAHDAWPLDGFYFNIAQSHRNLGHTAEAIDYFERYLKSETVKNRAEVEQVLAELRQKKAADDASLAALQAAPPESAKIAATSASTTEVTSAAAGSELAATEKKDEPVAAPSGAGVAEVDNEAALAPGKSRDVAPPLAATTPPKPGNSDGKPIYKKPWFWAVTVGAFLVVGGSVTAGALASSQLPSGSLGTADWR